MGGQHCAQAQVNWDAAVHLWTALQDWSANVWFDLIWKLPFVNITVVLCFLLKILCLFACFMMVLSPFPNWHFVYKCFVCLLVVFFFLSYMSCLIGACLRQTYQTNNFDVNGGDFDWNFIDGRTKGSVAKSRSSWTCEIKFPNRS